MDDVMFWVIAAGVTIVLISIFSLGWFAGRSYGNSENYKDITKPLTFIEQHEKYFGENRQILAWAIKKARYKADLADLLGLDVEANGITKKINYLCKHYRLLLMLNNKFNNIDGRTITKNKQGRGRPRKNTSATATAQV